MHATFVGLFKVIVENYYVGPALVQHVDGLIAIQKNLCDKSSHSLKMFSHKFKINLVVIYYVNKFVDCHSGWLCDKLKLPSSI